MNHKILNKQTIHHPKELQLMVEPGAIIVNRCISVNHGYL